MIGVTANFLSLNCMMKSFVSNVKLSPRGGNKKTASIFQAGGIRSGTAHVKSQSSSDNDENQLGNTNYEPGGSDNFWNGITFIYYQ